MKLLAIETATDICSVAYILNGNCINVIEEKIPRQHAEKLPIFYNELITQTKLELSEIDAICVSIGPGSFTGLRIGLSYAKGLAYSHQKPIVPVPTLQSLVYGSALTDIDIVMLHSHSNKYFFQKINSANKNKIDGVQVLELTSISDINGFNNIDKIIHYNCENLFTNVKDDRAIQIVPSAKWIGEIAHKNYKNWVIEKPYKLVPEYVSPFKLGS